MSLLIFAVNWVLVTESTTLGIFLLCVLALIVYDMVVYSKAGGNATISTVLYLKAKKYPVIPFLLGFFIGFIMGHIFWQTW